MKGNIPIEFALKEAVLIRELQTRGQVDRISVGDTGVEYKVSYWWTAERKECWLPASELSALGDSVAKPQSQ